MVIVIHHKHYQSWGLLKLLRIINYATLFGVLLFPLHGYFLVRASLCKVRVKLSRSILIDEGNRGSER